MYQQPPPIPGPPRPMLEPIDWNYVAILDPDIVRRAQDYNSLQKLVQQFSTAKFTQGCSRILAHPLCLRLCQLLQISIEFMNYSQGELQARLDAKQSELEKSETKIQKAVHQIKKLQAVLKIKSQPYEKCPVCDKKFKDKSYLDKHFYSRHKTFADAWHVIRGEKIPQKEDELQKVLEQINNLKVDLKRARHNTTQLGDADEQIEAIQKHQENIVQKERERYRRELFEAADELNMSMTLLNAQKEQQAASQPKRPPPSNVFNIFSAAAPKKPSSPPLTIFHPEDSATPSPPPETSVITYNQAPKSNKSSPRREKPKEEVPTPPPKKKVVLDKAYNFINRSKQPAEDDEDVLQKAVDQIGKRIANELAQMKSPPPNHDPEYLQMRRQLEENLEQEIPIERPSGPNFESHLLSTMPDSPLVQHIPHFQPHFSSEYDSSDDDQYATPLANGLPVTDDDNGKLESFNVDESKEEVAGEFDFDDAVPKKKKEAPNEDFSLPMNSPPMPKEDVDPFDEFDDSPPKKKLSNLRSSSPKESVDPFDEFDDSPPKKKLSNLHSSSPKENNEPKEEEEEKKVHSPQLPLLPVDDESSDPFEMRPPPVPRSKSVPIDQNAPSPKKISKSDIADVSLLESESTDPFGYGVQTLVKAPLPSMEDSDDDDPFASDVMNSFDVQSPSKSPVKVSSPRRYVEPDPFSSYEELPDVSSSKDMSILQSVKRLNRHSEITSSGIYAAQPKKTKPKKKVIPNDDFDEFLHEEVGDPIPKLDDTITSSELSQPYIPPPKTSKVKKLVPMADFNEEFDRGDSSFFEKNFGKAPLSEEKQPKADGLTFAHIDDESEGQVSDDFFSVGSEIPISKPAVKPGGVYLGNILAKWT